MTSPYARSAPLDVKPVRLGPTDLAAMERLSRFIAQTAGDASFRRQLATEAGYALGRYFAFAPSGIDGFAAPTEKPDVLLNAAQLFGFHLGMPDKTEIPPQELRLLAYGTKPAALLHGQESYLMRWAEWARKQGWTAILSPYEWVMTADDGKGGYANLATDQRRARAGSDAQRSLIVSPDPDRAEMGWLGLTYGWDALMGAVLGYPPCCAASFDRRWPEAVARHSGDVAALMLAEAGPGAHPWRTNSLTRYFGYSLIEHFPCRPDCPASLAIANRAFEALALHEPEFAAGMQSVMSAPALYTDRDGIALLPGGTVEADGTDIRFPPERMACTQAGALASALAASDGRIKLDRKGDGFEAGGVRFSGRVALFEAEPEGETQADAEAV